MTTLAVVLAGIVVLLVALLAVPIEFSFRGALAGPGAAVERSGRFRWAFGMVDVPLPGRKASRERRAERKSKPKSPRKKSMRRHVRRLVLNPAAWERARVLLAALIRSVQWRMLRLDARFGLDDPADTGRLWSVVGPLLVMLPRRLDVAVQPVFEEEHLAFNMEAEIRVVPLRVMTVLVQFGLSPTTWRVLWPVLRHG